MPDLAGRTAVADSPGAELRRKVSALRGVCVVETATFVLLWVCIFAGSLIGKELLGSIHGMTFLAFAAMTLGVAQPMAWSRPYVVAVVVLGPVGAVLVYERIRRQGVPPEAVERAVAARAAKAAARRAAATRPGEPPRDGAVRAGAGTPSSRPTRPPPGE